MADKDDEPSRITPSAEETPQSDTEADEEAVVDIQTDEEEEIEDLENEQVEQLSDVLQQQQDRINELAEQIALLSTRIAHSEPGIGVCSVCHGPVVLEEPEDSDTPHTIRCQQCGEVYHQY